MSNSSPVPKVDCVNTYHGAASVYCTDCDSFYCRTCCTLHKNSHSLNDHRVALIEHMSKGDIKQATLAVGRRPIKTTCIEHWEPCRYECKDCKTRMCATCRTFEHIGHDIKMTDKFQRQIYGAGISAFLFSTSTRPIPCVKSGHACATVFCKDCRSFYCDICTALHQNFDLMSGHRITAITQMTRHDIEHARNIASKTICAEHRQPLKLMCKTCTKLICTSCCIEKHQTHSHEVHQVSGHITINTNTAEGIPCFKTYHGNATAFCADCNEFYCNFCSVDHQLYPLMSGHRQIQLDRMSSGEIDEAKIANTPKQCSEHNMSFSIMCKTCNTKTCRLCVNLKHDSHNLQTLGDAVREAIKTMEGMASETDDLIAEQHKLITFGDYTSEQIRSDVKMAKTEIKQAAINIRDLINKHENDMLHDLDKHIKNVLMCLEFSQRKQEERRSRAVKCMENIERLLVFGKDIELVEQAPLLQKDARARKNTMQQRVIWKYECRKKLQTERPQQVKFGAIQLIKSETIGKHVKQVTLNYTGRNVVSGLVVVGDCLCVTHTGDSHFVVI